MHDSWRSGNSRKFAEKSTYRTSPASVVWLAGGEGRSASLEWSDVDRDGRVIRLRAEASKTAEGRVLALEGELWDLIERRWKAREYSRHDGTVAFSLHVFHNGGEPIGDFRKA